MTTWALLGGPRHEATGSEPDPVPEGYVEEGPGSALGPFYDHAVQAADTVYRWESDAKYIADGRRLLNGVADGSIQFETSALGEMTGPAVAMGFGAFEMTLGLLHDQPQSDEAQMARDTIDAYRDRGVI